MYFNHISNKYVHIFVATNALQFLLINEYVNKFKILNNNIVVLDLRRLNFLVNVDQAFYPEKSIFKRILKKVLSIDLTYSKLSRYILKREQEFILYVPWDLDLFYQLRDSKLCGHVYVEEGDLDWLESFVQ